jgi:hypothetical protein
MATLHLQRRLASFSELAFLRACQSAISHRPEYLPGAYFQFPVEVS